jgi:hypothetical protein
LIVGNPPWIDWKNLPAGYRERVKQICIERHLFSGDSLTGGINLNICALISNVSAMNWLKEDGILAFLMPQTIIFQQTYEGFRKFKLTEDSNLYLQQLFDWTKSGNPFHPVTHKFLTFFFSNKKVDYRSGIPLKYYIKNPKFVLRKYQNTTDFDTLKDVFTEKNEIAGQVSENSSIFSLAKNLKELNNFSNISGSSIYTGREGVEFYPQELFLLEVDTEILSKDSANIIVKNYQNKKSKYKIPPESFPLEKKYLHPLVKGVDIERFHLIESSYIVPFPYEKSNTRSPISLKELAKSSKLLAAYFNKFKKIFESQTQYNAKIIGEKHNTEFYALARVGEYSFADHYVAFRDNSKWCSTVVSAAKTPWGELKRPQFQNHAVTISQNVNKEFISLDEAHFICAILNAPITSLYILNSSDSRSFKINPPIFIPQFDANNEVHKQLSTISVQAHLDWDNKEKMIDIDKVLDELVIKLKRK